MIKKVSILGCEFCHAEFDSTTAANVGYMCPHCDKGKVEKQFKEKLSKLESSFKQEKTSLQSEYEDWLSRQQRDDI